MTVSVVVPWSPGCSHRERAWDFVQGRYAGHEVVTGAGPPGPYNRSAAILDGAAKASGDVLVIADADVFCDIDRAVAEVATAGWAVPHRLIHRLSPESTQRVYAGADWRGLPLSNDNAQDRRPYRGNATGTLLVIRRDVLDRVPPDARFIGWGSEDNAWAIALRSMVGPGWRGVEDLVHLWHPPQPRLSRVVGTEENRRLLRRYQRARCCRSCMERLVAEAREEVAACSQP